MAVTNDWSRSTLLMWQPQPLQPNAEEVGSPK